MSVVRKKMSGRAVSAVLVVALVIPLVACSGGAPPPSGVLRGHLRVFGGPQIPAADAPTGTSSISGVEITARRVGSSKRHLVRVAPDGTFATRVPAGTYIVEVPGIGSSSQRVTVTQGQSSDVTLRVDLR